MKVIEPETSLSVDSFLCLQITKSDIKAQEKMDSHPHDRR